MLQGRERNNLILERPLNYDKKNKHMNDSQTQFPLTLLGFHRRWNSLWRQIVIRDLFLNMNNMFKKRGRRSTSNRQTKEKCFYYVRNNQFEQSVIMQGPDSG